VYWKQSEVTSTEALFEKLKEVAQITPQPGIQVRGDGYAPYEHVGSVVLACQRVGILKIGFHHRSASARLSTASVLLPFSPQGHPMAMNVGGLIQASPK
jgi:hypothetical protein